MDDHFYRKEKKRFAASGLAKRLLRNKRAMLGLVLGVPVFLFVLFGNRGVVQRVRLEYQKQELKAKILEAEEETKRLQAASKALEGDKHAIEKAAREKYGMLRDGETVYKIRKDE